MNRECKKNRIQRYLKFDQTINLESFGQAPEDVLKWRIFDFSKSHGFRRTMRKLALLADTEPELELWQVNLSAIILIECRERIRSLRALEWCLYFCRVRINATCGPYQMTAAPFPFKRSSYEAVSRLKNLGCTPNATEDSLNLIAQLWHGAATRQSGSLIGYGEALKYAVQCVKLI